MTIAVDHQLRHDSAVVSASTEDDDQLTFGRACENLFSRYKKTRLRAIFQQDDGKNPPGWIRGLHSALSNYSHSRPGFDSIRLWEGSNGPIYVKSAFLWNVKMWMFTYASCVVLLRIADPSIPKVGDIFSQTEVAKIGVLRKAADFLWGGGQSN
jgi:hypothetical protein